MLAPRRYLEMLSERLLALWYLWKVAKLSYHCADKPCILHRPRTFRSYLGVGWATRLIQKPCYFRILDLPTELIHMVVKCAPARDAISLKLSCLKLYHCGPPLTRLIQKSRGPFGSEVDPVCVLERVLRLHKGEIFCKGCLCFHHPVAFTQEQLLRGDDERCCVGRARHVYFTPDASISYQQIAASIQRPHVVPEASVRQNRVVGTEGGSLADYGVWIPPKDFGLLKVPTGVWLCYEWRLDLALLPGLKTNVAGRTQLTRRSVRFCPHLGPESKDITLEIRKMLEKGAQNFPAFCSDHLHRTKCPTFIYLRWRKVELCVHELLREKAVVCVYVHRQIGMSPASSALDPYWIATIEERPEF